MVAVVQLKKQARKGFGVTRVVTGAGILYQVCPSIPSWPSLPMAAVRNGDTRMAERGLAL